MKWIDLNTYCMYVKEEEDDGEEEDEYDVHILMGF